MLHQFSGGRVVFGRMVWHGGKSEVKGQDFSDAWGIQSVNAAIPARGTGKGSFEWRYHPGKIVLILLILFANYQLTTNNYQNWYLSSHFANYQLTTNNYQNWYLGEFFAKLSIF